MRQIEFLQHGTPHEVVRCAQVAEPEGVGSEEVLVKVLAFPINPADLLALRGTYPRTDATTRAIGNEAVAQVEAVGAAVEGLAPGDRVVLLSLNNWREYRLVKSHEVIKVSPRADFLQQAGLKVNLATAALLLRNFVPLKPGDWFLQNAANSSVCRAAIQLAQAAGIRTANIVRRVELVPELTSLGADVVLLDGDDLPERLAAASLGARMSLAADSIAGAASNRLAACLAQEGTLVVYGAMSGEPIVVDAGLIVFRDLRIRSVWLTQYLRTASPTSIASLYQELDELVVQGRLATKIDSVFEADDIRAAVRRAGTPGTDGKVMVRFG